MSDEGWLMVRQSSAIGVDARDNEGQAEGGRGRSTGAAQTKRSETSGAASTKSKGQGAGPKGTPCG